MRTSLQKAAAVFMTFFFLCTPAHYRIKQGSVTAIPAINERIWLAPLSNKSSIQSFNKWPRDTLQQSILMRNFDDIAARLLAEFRRCEKFGLYRMVEDSGQATLRAYLTIGMCAFTFDTLTFPLHLHVAAVTNTDTYDLAFKSGGSAPLDENEYDAFHYLGIVLCNFVNSFPYQAIVSPFYSSLR